MGSGSGSEGADSHDLSGPVGKKIKAEGIASGSKPKTGVGKSKASHQVTCSSTGRAPTKIIEIEDGSSEELEEVNVDADDGEIFLFSQHITGKEAAWCGGQWMWLVVVAVQIHLQISSTWQPRDLSQ